MLQRDPRNPVVTPEMVRPSRPEWQVDGSFNAGVTRFGEETILLVRIAESVAGAGEGEVRVPLLEEVAGEWRCTTRSFARDDPA